MTLFVMRICAVIWCSYSTVNRYFGMSSGFLLYCIKLTAVYCICRCIRYSSSCNISNSSFIAFTTYTYSTNRICSCISCCFYSSVSYRTTTNCHIIIAICLCIITNNYCIRSCLCCYFIRRTKNNIIISILNSMIIT